MRPNFLTLKKLAPTAQNREMRLSASKKSPFMEKGFANAFPCPKTPAGAPKAPKTP